MIILKLKGGLGNQIFQYAFGLNLSRLTSKKLYIDLSYYNKITLDTKRNYELLKYPIEIDGYKKDNILKQLFESYIMGYKIDEKKFEILDLTKLKNMKKIIIDGYWQSEKYFDGSENIILEIFNNFNSQSDDFIYWKSLIEKNHSTSIHVRRGDYVHNLKAAMVHEVSNLDYYQNAMVLMQEKNKNTNFFIFTDDVDWVKKNFNHNNLHIVSDSKMSHFEELSLMSLCNNNIISNSTFSWWGAWLNKDKRKFIISPKKWFKDDRDIINLIPTEWKKI